MSDKERESSFEELYSFASEPNKKNNTMARVTYIDPVDSISGKINKTDNCYGTLRYGKSYINRIKNPFKGAPTASQLETQRKFALASAATSEIMKDTNSTEYMNYLTSWKNSSNSCFTLRGYIFSQEMAKL